MLIMVGEKTKMIYFGAFAMIGLMTLIMAHTAVAAAIYPLLMAIYALYKESDTPTKFGKGLFIGMAYSAGAGSIVTLLGSARAIVAIGFFKSFTGREITFLELSYYMLPLGWSMLIIIWLFISTKFKPERATIPGLRQRAISLNSKFGPLTSKEKSTLIIVFSAIAIMGLQAFIPSWQQFNKSAIILIAMLMFFLFKILTIEDLEQLPWNIALLFGGAMSIGYCLWDTGAAKWLAVNWLAIFQNAHWLIFILGIGFFVLIMTNFIMNVAAIAISLPVALVIAPYLGISPEAVFYVSLATAGMPFVLLVGAAPNAIAYESRQFTSGEFFLAGVPMSLILMAILTAFILIIWPLMGMPILN
jgi:sodium-dependent dicarboxylate transporter 2/3/5